MNAIYPQRKGEGDDFIATEWVMLALAEQGDTKKIFERAGVTANK